MVKEVIKVVVTQSSWQHNSWYNNKIGEIFTVGVRDDVYSPMEESYVVIENGDESTKLINKSDFKKLI